MTTKKKTTKTAKVTDTITPVYVAVDAFEKTFTGPLHEHLLVSISDSDYYFDTNIDSLVMSVEDDGLEDDQDVFKVTFTKVGNIKKPKVTFTKEG